ncbi:MAG: hypothetical protein KJ971_04605 [Firmicutes bacterium]|nr:hypothetical protein [Bacillota bacterium]
MFQNIVKFLGNIDKELFQAQHRYERAIVQYMKFRDAWVDAKVDYEKLLGEKVESIKDKTDKVTNAKEIAKSYNIEKYREMLKLETRYKYYKKVCEGLSERIQTIKYIGRIKQENINNQGRY